MSKDTTIGLSNNTKELLDKFGNGNSYEEAIENLIILKGCPKCLPEDEVAMEVEDTYTFEPLYFDMRCPECGFEKEHWRIPFEVFED